MRTLMQSLLATTAFLTLAPTVALANPYFCYQICNETVPCNLGCRFGPEITTCGDMGICSEARADPSEVTASAPHDEARQSDAAAQVCDEAQAPELSASAES